MLNIERKEIVTRGFNVSKILKVKQLLMNAVYGTLLIFASARTTEKYAEIIEFALVRQDQSCFPILSTK